MVTKVAQSPDAISTTETSTSKEQQLQVIADKIGKLNSQIGEHFSEIDSLETQKKKLEKEISRNNPSCWQRLKNFISSDSVQENLKYIGMLCLAILGIAAFMFLLFLGPMVDAGDI